MWHDGRSAPLDDLRIALGEVDVLANLTAAAYDSADWMDPDPGVIESVASLLGLIKKSATAAMAAFHRLHGAVADAAPATAGEAFDYSDGTAPGRDAELLKRDAEIVRRLRERLAEALDCPTSYPFFRRDWLPGENADEALLRIYRSNKQVLDRSDDDIINAIVEHLADTGAGRRRPGIALALAVGAVQPRLESRGYRSPESLALAT